MRTIAGACILAALAGSLARGAGNEQFQMDLQGRSMYSKYNFTDVIHPYEGVDSYLVVKGALWLVPEMLECDSVRRLSLPLRSWVQPDGLVPKVAEVADWAAAAIP